MSTKLSFRYVRNICLTAGILVSTAAPAAACQFYSIRDTIVNGKVVRTITPLGPSRWFFQGGTCFDDGLTCGDGTHCQKSSSVVLGSLRYCACEPNIPPLPVNPDATQPTIQQSSVQQQIGQLTQAIQSRQELLERLPELLVKNPGAIEEQATNIAADIQAHQDLLDSLLGAVGAPVQTSNVGE